MNQRHTNKAARAADPGLRLTRFFGGQGMAGLSAPHSWAHIKHYHVTEPNKTSTVIRSLDCIVPHL